MKRRDIPLDQAIALVRGAQKLNCDTADQLHAMIAKRCGENDRLRSALRDMIVITKRTSSPELMFIAVRKCAEHALKL